jgi:hypothetical protein
MYILITYQLFGVFSTAIGCLIRTASALTTHVKITNLLALVISKYSCCDFDDSYGCFRRCTKSYTYSVAMEQADVTFPIAELLFAFIHL